MRHVDTGVAQEVELKNALSEVARLSKLKSQFLSNINHEMRTPITAILGFCELLQRDFYSNIKHREYLESIRKSGWRMSEIIDDLFYLVQIESGSNSNNIENISSELLRDVFRDVFAKFSVDAEMKGLIFEIQEAEILDVRRLFDRQKLLRILGTLVSNAIKFSDSGTITLRAGTETPSGDALVIEVEDQGCGISVDGQALIFEPFTQFDGSATRRYGGVGVGLAICRSLAEAIRGRIELHSDPGVGSCFRVIFPAPVAEGPVEDDNRSDGGPLETVRVLVVDDNETNRHMFGLMLAALGAEVSMAENGQVAVDLCKIAFFDVVLMDIHMPVLDGPAALKKIREGQGLNADTPVVAFTAGEGGGDLSRLADFDGVVRKPVEILPLVQLLNAVLVGTPRVADDFGGRELPDAAQKEGSDRR